MNRARRYAASANHNPTSIGVFLTAIGDAGIWAAAYGYLPYPWSAAVWFVWLPAAAAFALAPAYRSKRSAMRAKAG